MTRKSALCHWLRKYRRVACWLRCNWIGSAIICVLILVYTVIAWFVLREFVEIAPFPGRG